MVVSCESVPLRTEKEEADSFKRERPTLNPSEKWRNGRGCGLP